MRRATALLAACLCGITGCQGGAAQEPYDGIVVTGPASTTVGVPPAAPPPADEPIASEVDIPWTIALLSDDAARVPKAPRPVLVVERAPATVQPLPEISIDLQLAADHRADGKPATVKVCPGVVKGRS